MVQRSKSTSIDCRYMDEMRIEKKRNFFLFCNQCRKGAESIKNLYKQNKMKARYSTLEICP